MGAGFWPPPPVRLPFAAIAGFGMISRAGAIQSLLQLESNPAYRGRIMALHGVSFEIGCIAGALFIGHMAKATSMVLALGTCVALLLALWLAIRGPLMASAEVAPSTKG